MRSLLLFILLLIVGCTQVPPLTPKTSSIPESSSVVVMKSYYDFHWRLKTIPACGGVIVGKHLIITAAHCVGAVNSEVEYVTRDVWFKTTGGKDVSYVVETNPTKDIAYLYSPKELGPAAEIRTPQEGEFKLVVKRFKLVRDYANKVGELEIKLSGGDSGSGVFGEDGKLLGIIHDCNTKEKVIVNDHAKCDVGGDYRLP